MSDISLKELWSFDDADLDTNRLGQLTEKQMKFLIGEHKSQRGVFLGVGGVVVLLFVCLPILLIGSRVVLPMLLKGGLSELQELIPVAALGVSGVAGIGFALLMIGTVVAIYVLRASKPAEIEVKHAEGKVAYTWGTKRVRTPGSSVRSYEDVRVLHLNLGDKKFEVKEKLQGMIQEGEEWAIYYTANPFKFLSAERKG